MKKIKGIFFDMDGVLIEAKDWHYHSLNKSLNLFGFNISRNEHLNIYDGLSTKEKLKILSRNSNLPENIHPFINQMKQIYLLEEIHKKCFPYFIHQYALSRLKNENYQLAVCSNSIKYSIQLMMEKSKLIDYLDFFLSNEDVTEPKPSPEIYQTAINKTKLKPEQVLILEDNYYGIKAAKASGAHVMKIKTIDDVNYLEIKKMIEQIENDV